MADPRVRVFLDEGREPIADYTPPASVSLNTEPLADGEHSVRVEAVDRTGAKGVRHVRFIVRNGPGITISGLNEGAIVHGSVDFMVNAFGAQEPFEPHRAESRAPIPVWVWVLFLIVVAWSGWYVQVFWQPPASFIDTPTYATPTMGSLR